MKKAVTPETAAAEKIETDNGLEIDNSFPTVAGIDPAAQFQPLTEADQTANRMFDVVKAIMSTEGMEVRSVLETKHEIALIRISMFAEKYGSKLAKFLYDSLLEIRVSHGGRGRKDMVTAMQAAIRGRDDETDSAANERKRGRFFH